MRSNALGALGAAASPSTSRLIAASAFHKPDGTIDPVPFQPPPLPASGTQVMTAPLAASPGPAPVPVPAPPPAPQLQPQPVNTMASLGQGAPGVSPRPPANPVAVHAHIAGQRIMQLSDADLAAYRVHNANAHTAMSGLLAGSSVVYADVVRLLTALAEQGALPAGEALEIAGKLPTDPRLLRQVVIELQAYIAHIGVAMQGEHHRRASR